ncbi:MAG: ABC transporter substrate-binding protein [Desulfofustis sp.]|nr:ABC transporter substrate-binding protein [Desulfofustis sp.]NNF47812.1 ABC transporter substrate-binding protein [Desulfofustis sp.]NNK14966.1 ABC transporter substrate-binding protein [Desulfofustis sp.]NNK57082.1 ABC transporter substrate-binding protein [Desulfofustis sp.]RZW25621.1 MAG: ABC transporter substrate-binding protein [Desulfobulbaceae bacterium]
MKKLLMILTASAILAAAGALAAAPMISVNQFVEHPALDSVLKGLQDYLKDNGVEAEFKVHNAQANMGTATQIGQQMIGEKSDLLVAIATPSAQATAQALSKAPAELKRPMLFTAVTDPVAAGLVEGVDKPGEFVTGVSDLLPTEKHLEMIMTYKPDINKLAILYNAGEANSKAIVASVKELSDKFGFTVVEATAPKTADVYAAAKSLVGRCDAVFIPTDNTIVAALESVIKVGTQNKLPIFAADVASVERGVVAAMGFDYYKHGYQTGAMAKKILEGAAPSSLPVEFQEELQLQINLKAAEAMGAPAPEALVKQASKIYE